MIVRQIRQRAACCVLMAILAASHSRAAQPDGGTPLSLDQLMTTLRSVRHVEARYDEHRTLRALRTPIETHGTLRFDAPDHLEKTSDPAVAGAKAAGGADRMAIDGNRLTIDRGPDSAPMVLMLNEHPEIGVLIESIRATLAGDGQALRRVFDISLAGTAADWQIVLQPHDPEQREILQWMRITGHSARITAIDTQQGDGGYSEMTIVEGGR